MSICLSAERGAASLSQRLSEGGNVSGPNLRPWQVWMGVSAAVNDELGSRYVFWGVNTIESN